MTVAATPGDRAADRLPFRRTLDRHPAREPPGPAGGRARRCGSGCWPPPAARSRAFRWRRSTCPARCCSATSPRWRPGAPGPAGPASRSASGLGGPGRLLRGDRAQALPVLAAPPPGPGGRRSAVVLVAASGSWRSALVARRATLARGGRRRRPGPAGLRVTVLDVGQGDAILFQPAGGAADPGRRRAARRPAGREAAARPASARLGAAVVTHDQSDHAGGIEELLGADAGRTLLYAVAGRRPAGTGQGRGRAAERIAAGGELRSGRLRLDVLWPPPELLDGAPRGRGPQPPGAGHGRPLGTLLDAAHRRRGGRVDADRPGPGRRAQGRPPRQRRRRPRRAARTDAAEARGDLGRRRQHLRPPDRRDARDAGRAMASAPCAPTATARSSSR